MSHRQAASNPPAMGPAALREELLKGGPGTKLAYAPLVRLLQRGEFPSGLCRIEPFARPYGYAFALPAMPGARSKRGALHLQPAAERDGCG